MFKNFIITSLKILFIIITIKVGLFALTLDTIPIYYFKKSIINFLPNLVTTFYYVIYVSVFIYIITLIIKNNIGK